jgi:hypothetical protein
VNREGTLHIVRVSIGDKYAVGFADYATSGGAMKIKEIIGKQALRDFFTSIGVQPNTAESALKGLETEGTANVLSVVLPEEMLISLGLADHPQFVPVRFTVFREPSGPRLAYSVAGPFTPATFSSKAGVPFPDMASLIRALDNAGLPGKAIAAGQAGRTYTISSAQLSQLGFRAPISGQRQVGLVDKPGAKVKRDDLERLDLVELAVLCQKVADDFSVGTQTAEQAWQLKREWVVLVARETPPPRSYKENDEIQMQKAALKTRMVDFLAALLG